MQTTTGIPLARQLDGMDLSHVLLGKEGKDREQVFINYGRGYFVRESRSQIQTTQQAGGVLLDFS
jgi:hypothetical protein